MPFLTAKHAKYMQSSQSEELTHSDTEKPSDAIGLPKASQRTTEEKKV